MQFDLTPEAIRKQFPQKSGVRYTLRTFETVTSTNQVALDWLRDGIDEQAALDFALVVAEAQTQGRGRMNHTWHSEAGRSLLFTLLLWDVSSVHLPWLSAIGGLAVLAALQGRAAQVLLKWPNDVLFGHDKFIPLKVSGILPEAVWDGDRLVGVALGIGVNISGSFAGTPLQMTATSIHAMTSEQTDRARLLAFLVTHVRAALRAPIGKSIARYRASLNTLGQYVRVVQDDSIIEGIAEDIDDGGALLVRDTDDNVLRRAVAGDLFMR